MTQSPHRLIAARIRDLRRARGWSAQRLAEAVTRVGIPWDRSIVANFETGRRSYVTAEELLALAVVLGVSPMTLVMPSEKGLVQLTPAVRTGWRPGWLWAVGEIPLTAERVNGDTRTFDRVDLFDPRVAEYIQANRPFEDASLVREIGRMVLARLSGQPFTVEISHDGSGRLEGRVTVTGADGGSDGERQPEV